MVEFFDYNCGWCKKGFPEVLTLIEAGQEPARCAEGIPDLRRGFRICREGGHCRKQAGQVLGAASRPCSAMRARSRRKSVDEIAAGLGLDMAQAQDRHGRPGDRRNPAAQPAAWPRRWRSTARRPSSSMTRLVPGYLPRAELAGAINDVRGQGRLQALLTVLPAASNCPPVTAYKRPTRIGFRWQRDEADLRSQRTEPQHAGPARARGLRHGDLDDIEARCAAPRPRHSGCRSTSGRPTPRANWSAGSTRREARPPASSSMPAAYTHTSVALHDALKAAERPDHRSSSVQCPHARAIPPSQLHFSGCPRRHLRLWWAGL